MDIYCYQMYYRMGAIHELIYLLCCTGNLEFIFFTLNIKAQSLAYIRLYDMFLVFV